jgi:hypothetical protein
MTAVLQLVTEAAVDEAWRELAQHRASLPDNPRLLLNREWVETDARLHARFIRLFRASEPPCPVVALE